nr:transporter [Lachnospiraceae bacterium]
MRKNLQTALLLILFYLMVAIPFKVMVVIPGFADIRPVTLLGPIYGLYFGIPGCIIFALMNLVMDIVGDSLRWSSLAGLAANLLGPFFILMFWKKMKSKGVELTLKTPANVALFALSLILAAILEAVIITPAVALTYPDVNALTFAISVIANTSIFPICFGIPI